MHDHTLIDVHGRTRTHTHTHTHTHNACRSLTEPQTTVFPPPTPAPTPPHLCLTMLSCRAPKESFLRSPIVGSDPGLPPSGDPPSSESQPQRAHVSGERACHALRTMVDRGVTTTTTTAAPPRPGPHRQPSGSRLPSPHALPRTASRSSDATPQVCRLPPPPPPQSRVIDRLPFLSAPFAPVQRLSLVYRQ